MYAWIATRIEVGNTGNHAKALYLIDISENCRMLAREKSPKCQQTNEAVGLVNFVA